jgi:putative chitinase
VTVATLKAISWSAPREVVGYAQVLNAAMAEFGITTQAQQAAFLAEAAQETIGFSHLTETGDGSRYEGRTDLGNNQPGDGARFKGRGFIQLTGRANYTGASAALFPDDPLRLVNDPDLVASDPTTAARASAWYWSNRTGGGGRTPASHITDTPSIDSFNKASAEINGWLPRGAATPNNPHGWVSREHYYQRALEAIYLGVGQSQQLKRVASGGTSHNVLDDNNRNPAHVAAALQTALGGINAYGVGSKIDV